MITKSFTSTCKEIARRPAPFIAGLAGATVLAAATALSPGMFAKMEQPTQPAISATPQLRGGISPSNASMIEIGNLMLKSEIIADNTPYQQKLVSDFERIRKAVTQCEQNLASCDERMAAYSEGVEVAALYAAQKNFNPLAVAGTMGRTVNMLMRYDHEEASKLKKGGDYRQTDEAIRIGWGVCLEQSMAKFIGVILALAKANVHIDEISIAIEKVEDAITIDQLRTTGMPDIEWHALMTIKAGGKEITYNNQSNTLDQSIISGGKIDESRIPEFIAKDSAAETLGAQENWWGNSTIENARTRYDPVAKLDLTAIYPIISGSMEAGLNEQQSYQLTSNGHDLLARLFKDLAAANDITIVAPPAPKADRLPRPPPAALRR